MLQSPRTIHRGVALPRPTTCTLENCMSTSGTGAVSVPAEAPALSQVERVVDTFVAPGKTFTDIRRSASWWLPWLISAIIGLALVYMVDKKVGMEKVTENQIGMSPKASARLDQLSPDQRASQLELSAKITRVVAYVYP